MRWRFGRYELDAGRRELRVDGALAPMQPQVFDVLCYLVAHRDRVVGKTELLDALWPDAVVTDASLQRAVSQARRALWGADPRAGERAPPARLAAWAPWRSWRPTRQTRYSTAGPGTPAAARCTSPTAPWGAGRWTWCWSSGGPSRCGPPCSSRARANWCARWQTRARVVLFDKRGTGDSDRVKALPSLVQREQDLEAVLDALRSPGAILVGFSEGGPMAIAFACRRPARTRGLALVGAFARMAAAPDHPAGWSAAQVAELRAYVSAGWGRGATLLAVVPERHRSDAVRAWAAHALSRRGRARERRSTSWT